MDYRYDFVARIAKETPQLSEWVARCNVVLEAFPARAPSDVKAQNHANDIRQGLLAAVLIADILDKNRLHEPKVPDKDDAFTLLCAIKILIERTSERATEFRKCFKGDSTYSDWMQEVGICATSYRSEYVNAIGPDRD